MISLSFLFTSQGHLRHPLLHESVSLDTVQATRHSTTYTAPILAYCKVPFTTSHPLPQRPFTSLLSDHVKIYYRWKIIPSQLKCS